MRDIKHGNA